MSSEKLIGSETQSYAKVCHKSTANVFRETKEFRDEVARRGTGAKNGF